MDAAAELGRNLVKVSTRFSLSMEMRRLTRDGTAPCRTRLARPNSQARTRGRGQGNIHFPCSGDHEQDWRPYPVDPYSSCYMCDTTGSRDRANVPLIIIIIIIIHVSAEFMSSTFNELPRGQWNMNFSCSAYHEQDWQSYPVDPYSAICDDHTYIHTFSQIILTKINDYNG